MRSLPDTWIMRAMLPRYIPMAPTLVGEPMEIQVGDRFNDPGLRGGVMTHPAVLHGGKSLRARIQRPGLPESEREVTWPAHERVDIRRTR
jgi:hypothetical protein